MADFKDFRKLAWYFQVLIVAGVSGALLAGFWYMYLTPIDAEITAKKSQLAELQGQIAKSMQQKKVFEQFKRDTAELQVKLEQLRVVLPQEKEIDQILRQVQQAASTSALRILRVVNNPIIDHDAYSEWPIGMEVVGTYHNIGSFLDKIRQLPRIVNINNLRIQGRASEGPNAFTASIGATYTATTFVYKEEQPANAPPPTPAK